LTNDYDHRNYLYQENFLIFSHFFLDKFLGGFWEKGKGHQPDVFGRTRLMA